MKGYEPHKPTPGYATDTDIAQNPAWKCIIIVTAKIAEATNYVHHQLMLLIHDSIT